MKRLGFVGGRRSTWQRPGWAAGSCLLHLLLVGVLILLQPATDAPKAGLRVRLVEEPQAPPSIEASQPARTPAPPPKSPSVVRRMARLLASGRVPPHATLPDEISIARVAPATPPTPPAAPVDVAPPAPPRVVEEAGGHTGGGRGAADGSGGSLANGAPERFSGAFLIPSAGSGTGLAGTGDGAAADSGGNGIGPGRGGAGEGNGAGAAQGGVASLGGAPGRGGAGAGVADLLRAIRQKIEHAKVYPETARREGIQGTVEVRFRIAGDGSVEAVEVVRSSGHRLLDEISTQTVRRAGPYPVLAGWIRIPLSYRLDR
jgi:TonB family protein